MRKSGQAPLVCGEKLIVRGRLVDKNCVPVSDARIFMWQVACDGKYPYKPLRHVDNKQDFNTSSQSTFLVTIYIYINIDLMQHEKVFSLLQDCSIIHSSDQYFVRYTQVALLATMSRKL